MVTKDELENIKGLLDSIAYAATKADGKENHSRLVSLAAHVKGKIDGYSAEKLTSAINYALEASGQVSNKEHLIGCMESAWYVFVSEVEE